MKYLFQSREISHHICWPSSGSMHDSKILTEPHMENSQCRWRYVSGLWFSQLYLWSINEQLRHMLNHLLQVMGCPLLLWVKACNFTWKLMGSRHLLNKDLCALHLANVTLRILSGSHCQQKLFVDVSFLFLVNFWSLPLQLFHLERRAGRQRHKLRNLTCETALQLFQIYDANL